MKSDLYMQCLSLPLTFNSFQFVLPTYRKKMYMRKQ